MPESIRVKSSLFTVTPLGITGSVKKEKAQTFIKSGRGTSKTPKTKK